MKINIIEIATPMSSEFTMFADLDVEKLRETKTIRVVAHHETKTRISTTLQIGQGRVGANFKMEGFKTFEETKHSYVTYNASVVNYFLKSKKQGLEQYKEYVKAVVESVVKNNIKLELDEVTVELEADKF